MYKRVKFSSLLQFIYIHAKIDNPEAPTHYTVFFLVDEELHMREKHFKNRAFSIIQPAIAGVGTRKVK
jgi:hypothetical protein